MKNNHEQSPAPQENKMGTMPEGKLLATMAVPMMISMLFQALYNVVDSIFVSQISQDALNAVSLAFPLQNLMIAVGGGTGLGINALLSRSLGERKPEMANRAANTGIFLSVCSSLVFAVAILAAAKPFYLAQTKNQVIVGYGVQYASICLGLSIGVFCQFCFERILQATGRTLLSMCTQLTGAVINMILDPILIFGLFGFPRLEVAGAAIATVAGQIVAACIAAVLNVKMNPEVRLQRRAIRWDKSVVREIYRIGIPSIVMQSISSVMVFGLNQILIAFTEAATAVFGAYFKLQSFIFMPIFGLNNGMVPIVSYNYGAARMDRVKKTFVLTAVTATVIMCSGCAAFNLIPEMLLSFFNPSAEMLEIGAMALKLISLSFVFAGYDIIAGSICQAIGNPMHTLIISVCRQLVVLLPVAWVLAQTGNLNLVWLSFPISELASLVLSTIFLRQTIRDADAKFHEAV